MGVHSSPYMRAPCRMCVYKCFAHPHDSGNTIKHNILYYTTLQQSHLRVVTKIRAGQTRVAFRLMGKLEIFLFSAAPRYSLGPTQPPIKQILTLLSKRKSAGEWRRPFISSLVPSLKMHGNVTASPHIFITPCLIRHRGNFVFHNMMQ